MNGYQGQIRARDQNQGYFPSNQEIFTLISEQSQKGESGEGIISLSKFGIFAPEGTIILLNNKEIKIGKTKMYQIDEVDITSIKFLENSSNEVIIDFVVSY